MRKRLVQVLMGSGLAIAAPAQADAFLVRDLSEVPTTGPGSRAFDARELGGVLYFRGDHPRFGGELWRSDGTAEGTRLLADLCPGPCGSEPRFLAALGGELFFFADDGVFGDELWATDGTRSGTRLVRDVCPGPCGSAAGRPPGAAVLGDRLIFAGDDGDAGLEPWISDGTRAGTTLLADLCAGPCDSTPHGFLAAGSRVFFQVDAGTDALWATDGTAAGTHPVVEPCFDCLPRAAAGGRLVFSRHFPPRGTELWASDGTGAGTEILLDACPGACNGSGDRFAGSAVSGGRAFFVAREDVAGTRALWRTDGTVDGTVRIAGEPGFHAPGNLTPVAGGLAFTTFNETFDRVTVWWTDGSPGGTGALVRGLRTFFAIFRLAAADDRLVYVTYSLDLQSRQLWSHDGDRATLLAELTPPPGSLLTPAFEWLTPAGDTVFLKAFEEEVGWELWAVDGAAPAASRIADLDADAGSSNPRRFAALEDRALFVADLDGIAAVLSTDGSDAGTLPLGAGPPSTLEFGRLGGRLLFSGDRPAAATRGLWSTDGTAAGTSLLADGLSLARGFAESGGRLYFSANDVEGEELRASDGTTSGTGLVVDLAPGFEPSPLIPCCPRSSIPHDLVAFSGGVLFGAGTGQFSGSDDELWRSDGTEAGTVRVRDICEGECDSRPRDLVRLGKTVLFSARDLEAGRELWRTDGTGAGTRRVLDLRPGTEGSDPRHLFVLGDRFYFFARGPRIWVEDVWGPLGRAREAGDSLWSTDGTAAGTERVHDLRVGGERSWVLAQETVGSESFFVVANEATGPELWATDGTAAGTRLVRDLRKGSAGSYPSSLAAVDGLLVFTADDGKRGAEAWVSDGTAAGTRLLADVVPGPGGSRPDGYVAAGDLLLMSAETPGSGRELWAIERADLRRRE